MDWKTGTPPTPGARYLCKCLIGGHPDRVEDLEYEVAIWDGEDWRPRDGGTLCTVVGWIEISE